MTAYQRGHKAGLNGDPPESCPYLGLCCGSRVLRMRWMQGLFEGYFGAPVIPRSVTYRKTIRRHWPRSEYARRRVMELLTAPER